MGMNRDSAVTEWQQRAGIQPAIGKRAELLERMQSVALDLIRVVELERSGIRDGDGLWSGSDPVDGRVAELVDVTNAMYLEPVQRVGA